MSKREWSQADLARYADLNRAVINKLLNGQSTPHPATLESIARAFKTPVERVYRIAGLLPEVSESEGFVEEIVHHINQIQNPKRKSTALLLIKALIAEEQEEKSRK
ncbi:MAG TPA: helix-turn-helix transcriptional regulator [Anaerolineales bacterium]|nr:helix-turn-helix transcriptional regulator [Anaerolineales bacterium]HNN12817.1 helix-turn-helix transcriptional regulator [Anaerolineales bacterium]